MGIGSELWFTRLKFPFTYNRNNHQNDAMDQDQVPGDNFEGSEMKSMLALELNQFAQEGFPTLGVP